MSNNNRQITVIGHKNPDTDSICSAIAYAGLKAKLDPSGTYKAGRAGQLNEETKFVLDYFGEKVPEYVSDVKTRIQDIEIKITDERRKLRNASHSNDRGKAGGNNNNKRHCKRIYGNI